MVPEGETIWVKGAVVIGGNNLPSPVGIGSTDLRTIGGPVAPLASQFRHHCMMTWCICNYCDAATLIKGAIHQASLDAALRFHSWAGVALVSL